MDGGSGTLGRFVDDGNGPIGYEFVVVTARWPAGPGQLDDPVPTSDVVRRGIDLRVLSGRSTGRRAPVALDLWYRADLGRGPIPVDPSGHRVVNDA
jgi:hypothetical protein